MVRHKSAVRQHRRSVRRTEINKRNKTVLRTQVKALRQDIRSQNKEKTEKALPGVLSAADKAAKKGVIHKNKAARLKSRLSRQVRAVTSSSSS
ncbi:MAG: 30S ribosomal protein S20 [Candidatus Aminicenantes bacterium]|nr:30S ribosomal protein S20 [Candidatus Aminicenantes bacterium]